MEQCIGTLKLRWPYVKDCLRCRPWNASQIFLTCCGLHNWLINIGEGYFEDAELDAVEHHMVPPADIMDQEDTDSDDEGNAIQFATRRDMT